MPRIFLLSLASLFFAACTAQLPSYSSNTGLIVNHTQCSLLADQGQGSLKGQWSGLPVRLVFDRDFYVTNQGQALTSVRAAKDTWNSWASLRGKTGFEVDNDTSGNSGGRDIPALTSTCNQADYSTAVTDAVGVWKINNTGDHVNARDSCTANTDGSKGKILPTGVQGQTDWITVNGAIVGASVLLNFEGFNAPGKQSVDLESLLLHELGHVLGLLHSCNGSSGDSIDSTTAPACSVAPNRYTDAVMFPFLVVNQVRRNLLQNDYNRINCLY